MKIIFSENHAGHADEGQHREGLLPRGDGLPDPPVPEPGVVPGGAAVRPAGEGEDGAAPEHPALG